MPPRGEAMDDLDHQPRRPRSSSGKKPRSRSSKQRRAKKDHSHDRPQQRRTASAGRPQDEQRTKDRGENKKKRSKKKPGAPSSSDRKPRPPSRKKASGKNSSKADQGEEGGVTVSKFMKQQQGMQDQASGMKPTLRQRMLQQEHEASFGPQPREGDAAHYFDDDDSDHEESDQLVVKRDTNRPPDEKQKVVDAVPADHPSSSIIQTKRTCSLCHRTLPRSQFSERDRYTVNMSLAPGPTCRTCSMTVCAVKLKSMPGTEQLLLEYAQRGLQQGMLAMENGAPIAGYLESSETLLQSGNDQALVVRKDSKFSTASGITGKELTLFGGPMVEGANAGGGGNGNVMGMPPNVNSAFAGQKYGNDDGDRPDHIADCKYIDALLRMPSYLNLNAFGIFTSSREASVSLAALEGVRLYGTLDEGYFVPHDCDGKPAPERKRRGKRESQKTDEAVVGNGKNAKSIVCLVLNEGPTPRTAILASQHYGWTTLAIDPTLSEEWDGYHDDIPGFTGYSGTISDFIGNEMEMSEAMIELRQENVQHLVIIGIQHEKDTLRLKGNGHINEVRNRYDDVPTTLVSLSPVRKATLAPQRRLGQCGSKLEKDIGYEPNCSYIDEGVFSECRQVEVWNFHNADDDDEGSDYIDEDDEGEYSGDEGSEYDNNEGEDEADAGHNDDQSADSGQGPEDGVGNSFEAQIKRAAKGNKKKKTSKRRNWLEERVAEHKKEKGDQVQDLEASMGSLSTKETLERLPSSGIDLSIVHAIEEEKGRPSKNAANPDEYQAERNNEEAWAPPDEAEVNQVWEKAMAKHGEQESLVNQFEEYYEGKSENQDSGEGNGEPENDPNNHGLPHGWEAIQDPSSGDYYYNNWETGEVTWDHPLGNDPMANAQCGEASSTNDGDGSGAGQSGGTKPMNPFDDDEPDAPSAESPEKANCKVYEQSGGFDSESESQFNVDDESSASSGIAALARWNKPETSGALKSPLTQSNTSGASEEEEMIAWSDEEDNGGGDGRNLERSESNVSQKQQPWHKKESDDHNDSFIYD